MDEWVWNRLILGGLQVRVHLGQRNMNVWLGRLRFGREEPHFLNQSKHRSPSPLETLALNVWAFGHVRNPTIDTRGEKERHPPSNDVPHKHEAQGGQQRTAKRDRCKHVTLQGNSVRPAGMHALDLISHRVQTAFMHEL